MSNVIGRDLHPSNAVPVVLSRRARIPLPHINLARCTSIIFWCAGAWLTKQCLAWKIHDPRIAWGVALLVQVALTKLESKLWHRWHIGIDGKAYKAAIPWYVWPALFFDMLFNVPGTWIGVVQDLHQWPPILSLCDMLIQGKVIAHPMTALVGWNAVIACVLIAVIPCGLPELLWWSGGAHEHNRNRH